MEPYTLTFILNIIIILKTINFIDLLMHTTYYSKVKTIQVVLCHNILLIWYIIIDKV